MQRACPGSDYWGGILAVVRVCFAAFVVSCRARAQGRGGAGLAPRGPSRFGPSRCRLRPGRLRFQATIGDWGLSVGVGGVGRRSPAQRSMTTDKPELRFRRILRFTIDNSRRGAAGMVDIESGHATMERVCRGGMPQAIRLTGRERRVFLSGYARTLASRDVSELGRLPTSFNLPTLMRILAVRNFTSPILDSPPRLRSRRRRVASAGFAALWSQ